jgi:hypothetical protein
MEGRLKIFTKVREESAINFDRIEEKRLQIPTEVVPIGWTGIGVC